MDDGTGGKEQQRLEESMGEQMEHGALVGTNTCGEKHVTELRTGGIGYDALDIVLNAANGRGK